MKIFPLLASGLLFHSVALVATAAEWLGPDEKIAGRFAAHHLEPLLAENKPGKDENIKAVPLFRSERASNVLVQVRDREPLHRHADSDITVFLLRGEGDMRIGKEALPVKAGSVIHIPRGVVHAYINRGPEPAAALVVYSPAPGPKDRILVEDKP
ncbi:MAG: cupin domain-containing protein [Pseudomonadota bacterium]